MVTCADLQGLGPQGRRVRSTRHPGFSAGSEVTRTNSSEVTNRDTNIPTKYTKKQKDEQTAKFTKNDKI